MKTPQALLDPTTLFLHGMQAVTVKSWRVERLLNQSDMEMCSQDEDTECGT